MVLVTLDGVGVRSVALVIAGGVRGWKRGVDSSICGSGRERSSCNPRRCLARGEVVGCGCGSLLVVATEGGGASLGVLAPVVTAGPLAGDK